MCGAFEPQLEEPRHVKPRRKPQISTFEDTAAAAALQVVYTCAAWPASSGLVQPSGGLSWPDSWPRKRWLEGHAGPGHPRCDIFAHLLLLPCCGLRFYRPTKHTASRGGTLWLKTAASVLVPLCLLLPFRSCLPESASMGRKKQRRWAPSAPWLLGLALAALGVGAGTRASSAFAFPGFGGRGPAAQRSREVGVRFNDGDKDERSTTRDPGRGTNSAKRLRLSPGSPHAD